MEAGLEEMSVDGVCSYGASTETVALPLGQFECASFNAEGTVPAENSTCKAEVLDNLSLHLPPIPLDDAFYNIAKQALVVSE